MIYIQVNAVGVALKVLENTVFLGQSVTLNLVYVPNGLLTEAVCMHSAPSKTQWLTLHST